MLLDIIIDGNYILSKLAFTLHKNNLLFGALHQALDNTIKNYRTWYPFSNIYLVSDSKEKSWRKQIISEYKATRKKDSDIDWGFVYDTYFEFKEEMKKTIKVLEAPHIEGDDWISFLVEKSNKEERSTIIISNDYDIKQIVKFNLDPLYINIMTNEMYNKQKLFLPINYQLFLNKVNSLPNNDIFNLNDNTEFISFIGNYIDKYEVNEINSTESLIIKIISGDVSDNIDSVWSQTKNGKKRGIGKTGAESVIKTYINEFGEIDINDLDLPDNIADLICEKKKISKKEIGKISDKFLFNKKLIDLTVSNLPKDIIEKMCDIYGKLE
jgi:5'-3' exonuclease